MARCKLNSFSISSFASDEVDYLDLLSLHGDSSAEHSASRSEFLSALSNGLKMSPTEHVQCLAPHGDLAEMNFDADLQDRLQKALDEIVRLKKENFEESCQRRQVEKELLVVHKKAKKLQEYLLKELKHLKETEEARATDQHLIQKLRKEIELLKIQRDEYLEKFCQASEQMLLQPSEAAKEAHEKGKHEMEILREKISLLKIHRDEYLAKFQEANEPKLALVECVSDTDCDTNALENDLEAYRCTLDSVQKEYSRLRPERGSAGRYPEKHSQFSLAELQLATENFSESLKIGEGGYGHVYKGSICDTTVAIKILRHNENLQGLLQFQREVLILSNVRHPHLVSLIGTCDEVSALVYEYLPNGSLEDRLSCKGDTPALTWQVRTRIIGEICSALIFLHSHKPKPVVHGDLKPSNILLDADLASKLGDFGIARFLVPSETSTMVHLTDHPIGTMFYSDPEYIAHGELTPGSDIFSFGIIILRLLTGRHPKEIVKRVENAMINDELHTIIDRSAGEWPFVQVQQLARIGMRCTAEKRRRRADLVTDVWPVIEPMMKSASLSTCPSTSSSIQDESGVPHYFLCPILQVMKNPHIAADGFTYEAEAIKDWFEAHDTSPMTNLALPNRATIPNSALSSAIQEHLQRGA
ncbi:U-box domain-containing protein 70-like isoform X2 [Phragmites australis]|uniref:U-box domain-containing protein 70-like isoform X2 n=1 Tax=Phragmites australis TaxID=29695 RepID=UPI002D785EC8|nr:U-box domain-containing protein 70-like isoform X2 [Phragmites australis]